MRLPFIIFATIAIIAADRVVAQAECSNIENDIARLECFDRAFRTMPEELASPRELYASFSETVRSVVGRPVADAFSALDTAFDAESCTLAISTFDNRPGRGVVGASISTRTWSIDLDQVEVISGGLRGLVPVIRMKRDQRLGFVKSRGQLPAGVVVTRDFAARRASEDAERVLQTTLSGRPNGFEMRREDNVQLITSETGPEVREITQDLIDLANSCQSSG